MQKRWRWRPSPLKRIHNLCWLSASLLLACFILWRTTTVAVAQSCPRYPSPAQRIGFNLTLEGGVGIADYDTARLGAGWYHDYRVQQAAPQPGGIRYYQMVRGMERTTAEQIQQLLQQLAPVIAANPGNHWLLGNEPDREGQDALTAAQYAVFYHDVYHFIKERDPSSHIAIGGIVQPTPLRLRYLDLVLAEYQQRYGQAMPVEIWDIHNFIMPENCSWGAGIPPGLEAYTSEGIACPATLADHGNLALFEQQLRTFRQWMQARGYRDRPLTVSEYGILLSQYHEYEYPRVRDFMLDSFDFMLNTTDSETGYPADGNRLVQEFAWFSLNYYAFDPNTNIGLNGNLFDHDSRQITPLGLDFEHYIKNIKNAPLDLVIQNFQAAPLQTTTNSPVSLHVAFANQGSVDAQNVVVRFWSGDPRVDGRLLGSAPVQPQILADCTSLHTSDFQWTPHQPGNQTIVAELSAGNINQESNLSNNYANLTIAVSDASAPATPEATPTPTPVATPPLTLAITFDPLKPAAGAKIRYKLHYTNQSNDMITNLALRFAIPAQVTLDRAQSDSRWECTAITPKAPCQLMISTLAAGAVGEIRLDLTLDTPLANPTDPVVLLVKAQDAAGTIAVEATAETIVSGQQNFLYYLPYVNNRD